MDKAKVVELFEEMALLMELADENPFKVRAYVNGARSLDGFEGDWPSSVTDGTLKGVKGIGPGLLADIKALVTDGKLPAYDALRAQTPTGLLEMMQIPGLGPKKVRAIRDGLGITTVGELEYACLENRLVGLAGFGDKTQAKVLASIERWKRNRDKRLYADVVAEAEALEQAVAKLPGALQARLVGDLRRKLEIVDRVELLAVADDPAALLAAFVKLDRAERAEVPAEDHATIWLTMGLPATLRVVTAAAFPLALLYATGTAAFVAGLEARAAARGLRLTPGALGSEAGGETLAPADEGAIFAALDLPMIPPELREHAWPVGTGVPTLISDNDLMGVFHVHTRYSDGEATVMDMALRARQMGYRYLGISDHSEAAFYAHGLDRAAIAAQRAEIEAINAELDDFRVLSGIEADILADGRLDYDDETLAGFDFVIASVHSRFGQDREAMTRRLVRALEHPKLTMLGHLSGRLLLSRDPYDFDLDAVLDAARRHGKVIELNANPHRLDLDWRDLARARGLGIPISINPDAHSPAGLDHTRFGVAAARKGGLQAADVFNARPLEQILAFLGR